MTTTSPNSLTRQLAVSGDVNMPVASLSTGCEGKINTHYCFLSFAAWLAGAAAFFAMREYEKHQDANGQPPSHQFAKEMMAGVAGAEVRC